MAVMTDVPSMICLRFKGSKKIYLPATSDYKQALAKLHGKDICNLCAEEFLLFERNVFRDAQIYPKNLILKILEFVMAFTIHRIWNKYVQFLYTVNDSMYIIVKCIDIHIMNL